MEPERRRFPRKQIQKIAYIHLEPDNGAIVVNASESGLGFHAAGPIEFESSLNFYISVKGQERQKIRSEVVWVDRTRKTGGLRLLTLPQECAALREWLGEITGEPLRVVRAAAGARLSGASGGAPREVAAAVQHATPQLGATDAPATEVAATEETALPAITPPPEGALPETAVGAASATVAPQTPAKTPTAPLADTAARGEPAFRVAGEQTGREAKRPGPGESRAPQGEERRGVAPRWGFAAMITLGMFCWVAMAAYVEHAEFGPAAARHSQLLSKPLSSPLEDLARKEPPASVAQPAQTAAAAAVSAQADSSAAMRELDADIEALEREYETDDAPPPRRLESKAARGRSGPRGTEERRGDSGALRGAQFAAKPRLPVSESGLRALQPSALQLSPLVAGAAREPASLAGVPAAASAGSAATDQPAAASGAAAEDAGGGSAKIGPQDVSDIDVSYFDVGKFREQADAQDIAVQLAKSGFPATVVPKRLLWMTFFHVVVGPYKMGDAAETARAQLEPAGYRPHYTRPPPGKP